MTEEERARERAQLEQVYGKAITKKYYSNNDYSMNYPEGYPHTPKEEPKKIDHVNPNC